LRSSVAIIRIIKQPLRIFIFYARFTGYVVINSSTLTGALFLGFFLKTKGLETLLSFFPAGDKLFALTAEELLNEP
jgi:hypothetical protein